MAGSCSHWWHAPFYTLAAVALLVAALSSPPSNRRTLPPSSAVDFAVNASLALGRSGFHLTAAILRISPDSLLSPPSSTFFAVSDAALALHRAPAERLFRYHTVPLGLPLEELLKKPPGTCLPTLAHGMDLQITKSDGRDGSVQINGVPISHPDIFVRGPYAIHGVNASFYSIDGGDASVQRPACVRKSETDADPVVPWARVVRVLVSNGFVSFAVGLNSVLDSVGPDSLVSGSGASRGAVTLFAPRDSGFGHVASPAPLLERAVRSHVAIGRFAYAELEEMRVGERLRTLAGNGQGELTITASGDTVAVAAINGVQVTEPDVYSEERFVVHGIFRAFDVVPTSN